MRIDPVRQNDAINNIKSLRKSKAAKIELNRQPDAIAISKETRGMPDIAAKITEQKDIRELVIKRYQDFVDKPLNISDQNILSALKNSLIT